MKSLLPIKLLFASACVVLTTSAYGQATLITDNFGRVGPLNGTAPTFSATPETWTAPSTVTTGSSAADVTLFTAPAGPERATAYIGIPGVSSDFTVGGTYTLSFTVTRFSGDSWMSVGFGNMTNTADVGYLGGNDAGFWALDNGGGLALFDDVGGTIHQIGGVAISGATNVVLTVTAGAITDTLSATVNGNPVTLSTTAVPVNIDPVKQVFLGGYQVVGTVTNFDLSGPAVPEPGTWALMLGGLGALVFVGRLRRKISL